jgi:hypothetical protein
MRDRGGHLARGDGKREAIAHHVRAAVSIARRDRRIQRLVAKGGRRSRRAASVWKSHNCANSAQTLSKHLIHRETIHGHSLTFRIRPRGTRLAL